MGKIDVYYEGNLATKCVHEESGKVILTEAPKDNQGKGGQFSPTDLVGAALGSCLLTIMGMHAERLKVDLTGARVMLSKEMVSFPKRRIGKLKLHFFCPGNFAPEVIEVLEKAAKECPVHHSLHPELIQEFVFTWGFA